METAQQVGQGMLGDGATLLVVGIVIIVFGIKIVCSGTLSEEAQRRSSWVKKSQKRYPKIRGEE
jgi:hypothetical protein